MSQSVQDPSQRPLSSVATRFLARARREWEQQQLEAAEGSLNSVLALSPVERPRRGLWAQYMLGRVLAAGGDTDHAIAAFETLRERALSGAADPLGIAVASFGEQARIQWHHGNVVDAVKSYAT